MTEIRVPKQQRAVKKRDAVIQAGYELFCQKGYYQTNTAEIAKRAGVSTGIVYSYFQNKEDILLQVVAWYLAGLKEKFGPVLYAAAEAGNDLSEMAEAFYELLYASHTMEPNAHDEFQAMAYLHAPVKKLFEAFEEELVQELCQRLMQRGDIPSDGLEEKLRLSYHILESLCHDMLASTPPREGEKRIKKLAFDVIAGLLREAAP